MFRLLVVEDNADLYQDYFLRLFENLLPMEEISLVHVPTLRAACQAMLEPWDFILMDYALGPKCDFREDIMVRDGADLTRFRRAVESDHDVAKAFILGTSSNQVGNRLIQEGGADNTLLKLQVVEMAQLIKEQMHA